ncbi:MAG: MerR family transcriptional regulator [Elusimicrobiota bacterium]
MPWPYTLREILKIKEYNKIGETVDILSERCPDITASAIRYWESEGLLAPTKTPGGQRLYTEADLELIRYIKELSRCGYSIKVIKEKIRKLKKGKEPIGWAADKVRKELAISRYMEIYQLFNKKEKTEPIYSKKDLIKILRSEIAKELLDTAVEYKIITPVKVKRKIMFSAYDEIILRVLIYKDEEFKDTFPGGWRRYIEECRDICEVCRHLYHHGLFICGKIQIPAKDYTEMHIGNALFNLISERIMYDSPSGMLENTP